MLQTFDVDVKATKSALLAQEDTNRDGKITIDDTGPKVRIEYSPPTMPEFSEDVNTRSSPCKQWRSLIKSR